MLYSHKKTWIEQRRIQLGATPGVYSRVGRANGRAGNNHTPSTRGRDWDHTGITVRRKASRIDFASVTRINLRIRFMAI